MKIRIVDSFIIGISILTIAAVSVAAYGGRSDASLLSIHAGGREYLYDLSDDRTVEVTGPLGTTIVKIDGREAAVIESPCINKICVKAGHIGNTGQWVACLPNGVLIEIVGGEIESDVDAVTF